MRKAWPYLLLMLLASGACFNLNRLSLYNLSGLYSTSLFTTIEAVAFNKANDEVAVHVLIKMQDLAAEEDESSGRSYSSARLSYRLFSDYESSSILDSASFSITDSSLMIDDTIVSFSIHYPGKEKYLLSLELDDLNRADAVKTFLLLDNTGAGMSGYMLIDRDGQPLFHNLPEAGESFSVMATDRTIDALQVRYYHRDFPLATPPFLEDEEYSFDYTPDSVFTVNLTEGRTALLELNEEGFYQFSPDTASRAGYTVYRFYDRFPQVLTSAHMLQPLRYITSRNEFAELNGASDKKVAVDNFWLDNAGSPMRARTMIQKFYGRVEEANAFFSSYHEGWKTDRGLVYIIYGPPQRVFRGKQIEEWLYGEKGNPNSIRFTFVKMDNPFSENDYSLVKSPAYKEKWYNIVNTWRK